MTFERSLVNEAVEEVAKNFVNNIESILLGNDVDLISENSSTFKILKKIKDTAVEKIYSHEMAEKVELCGRSVVKGLLNHFGELLKLDESEFSLVVSGSRNDLKGKNLDFHVRLFHRLPEAYREKYKDDFRGDEVERRAHMIVDFISGMTDDFALELYQILEGIRVR